VPIFNLMEDAATAEISRSQVWQWIRNPDGALNDGRKVSVDLFRAMLPEELAKIEAQVGSAQFAAVPYRTASELFDRITTDDAFVDFLTLPGYELLD
jgi:malate synthase